MSGDGPGPTVLLDLPGDGRWRVEHSPARRVPSHGTDLLGLRYAIDLVGTDADGRSARVVDWRTVVGVEPPERFVGFGRPVRAPVGGTVVAAHDGEPDHGGRRSPVTLLPYALGQAGRLRRGIAAVAGNHVVVARADGACVAVAHLRAGSVRVRVGQAVAAGSRSARAAARGTRPNRTCTCRRWTAPTRRAPAACRSRSRPTRSGPRTARGCCAPGRSPRRGRSSGGRDRARPRGAVPPR